MLRIAIVTHDVTRFQMPVFERLAGMPDLELHVFCSNTGQSGRCDESEESVVGKLEANRHFHQPRLIQSNVDMFSALARFFPDVLLTDGAELPQVGAFMFALARGIPHVSISGGLHVTEKNLYWRERLWHRYVLSKSKAFIASGQRELRQLERQGIAQSHCFNAAPCVDNEVFLAESPNQEKLYDFIFCGSLELAENPLFALDVAVQTAKRLRRRVRLLIVGGGSLRQDVEREASLFPGLVNVEFADLASLPEVAKLYRASRLLLLPLLTDAWGIAANESYAAGVPAIASPHAGAADELILDGHNGFVCALDVEAWAAKAEFLLSEQTVYTSFSERCREAVRSYNFDTATAAILAACRHAIATNKMKAIQLSAAKSKPRVLIVERQLLHYRVAFYNRLRGLLEREGIELQLLIGEGTPAEKKKMDEAHLEWAHQIPTRYLFGTNLCWQPFGSYAREADLVVVMHENKIIYNLWLLLFARPRRLAFWGHGANMQSSRPDGIKERFKRWTIKKVDWWFAYTETSAALVTGAGFPSDRTTIVENAFDTQQMSAFCREISAADCERKRKELNLGDGPIGLYLGSLYREKRLDFLIESAQRIHDRIPGFKLLVVGAGPEQSFIQEAASRFSWIRYLGPLQDKRKAEVLVLADVMLNPGLVGLGILDSFTSGTPMFTTDCGLHSPEISYLSSGHNGVMTPNDIDSYAAAVIDVLQEPDAITRLSKGALSSAPRYTIENMADRIRKGICACLEQPSHGNMNFRKT